MPASAARIGFILEEWRRAISETASVQTRYGSLARKTDDPVETWFDDVADAQAVADERQALLSPSRRTFKTVTSDIGDVVDLLASAGVPTTDFTDSDRQVSSTMLVAEAIIDLDGRVASPCGATLTQRQAWSASPIMAG